MAKFSKRMKRLLAVMLVEVIVATNVFVSYADEYNSDEPKVIVQMTESEADELAAKEAEETKEEADEAGDEEAFAEERETETPAALYGEETPSPEETENTGEAEAEAATSVIPAEFPTDETGNQEKEATATPSETPSATPSATPVKEEARASVKISAAFEDTEENVLEELAEKELTFEDSMDLTEAPFSVTGYEYKEARIDGITVTALHVTENTEESNADQKEADQSEENKDGVQTTVTLVYSYVTADGEEIVLTEDTTVTFIYEAEEAVTAEVKISAVDSFGDAIAEKYTDMDLDKLFKGGDILILGDTENPPVSKVQVRKGLFKVVQYQYVKATMDQKILTGLKREEVRAKDAEKKYVYSFSTDGEGWTGIEEDTTVFLEYTDGQKSVFTYEDDQVLVTATLQHAGAIPEDAQFVVTPVTSSSSDYNYDAYMNALNANADRIVADSDRPDGGRKTFTEENTLLYDVAFLAPEVDEEGNVQEDNLIEYQPAEGMVNVSFVFKQNQLSDGLEARSEEDLTIVHLPLQEAVKEETATTAAATDISAADVNVEIVADSVSLNGNTDQADFCLSSFSVVAVTKNGEKTEIEPMTDYSLYNILNNYNYFTFGDAKTIHVIGPVIVGGNAVNTSGVGGASAAVDGKLPQIPHNAASYVKGTASTVFKDIAASNYADLILYLGTVNKDSFSSVQTGLKNIIFTDEYVDFDAARASFISEAGSVKSDVTLTDADKQYGRVTVDAGSVYEIDNFDGVNELDIRGNVSDGNDTIIIVKASGNVQLPLPLINGVETPNTEDGPQMGITWILLNADSVNLIGGGHNHVGHVIAPNADVKKIGSGNYNGCIIANSFETGAEGHMWSYNGKTFTPAASGFKVQKQLLDTEGNVAAWPEGQSFTIILKGLDGAPMPADANGTVKSVVVKSTGIAGFGDITFPCDEDSQAAEYHYELREVKGSQEKIRYDETVYHITVKVSYQETSGNKKAVIESVTYTTDDPQDMKTVGESFVYSFTNVYDNIEKMDIPVSKIWVDENNQDGLRPESISAELYADGQETGNVLILNKGNNWSGRWTDLPKTRNGQEILYTIKEVKTKGYDAAITGDAANGFTITNTHKPEVTSIEGSKVWKDADNQDGKRPDSITVNLLANGEKQDNREVTEKDNWRFSFTGLPKYADGKEIVYTVTEDTTELKELGYSTVIDGTTIINSYTPGKTNVTVVKAWNDAENQDGIRPDAVKVQLYAGGSKKGSEVTLSEKNGWTYTWEGLDLKKSGTDITYTVKEVKEADGYTAEITAADGIIIITNTHETEKTEISVKKAWKDVEDQDGKRPEKITVNLYADGKRKETKTISEKDGWQWTFTGLDKYKNGREIKYTVDEETDGLGEYKKDGITGTGTLNNPYVITNSYTPELTAIFGTKIWKDHDNWGGMRPESITVNLFADGEKVGSQVVKAEQADENGNWIFRFSDLPKYKDGKGITYTINEEPVKWYTPEVNGTTITNSYTQKTTGFTVKKIWADGDNQDAIRPLSINVQLYRDNNPYGDKVVLSEKNGWSYTWTGLLESYAGHVYAYEAREVGQIRGYQTTAKTEGHETIITNTHTPEVTSVKGSKVWADDDNQDGKRPDSITIRLYADGREVNHVAVSKDNWSFSFTGLPKYKNVNNKQVEIKYTITEDRVEGYDTVITGEGTFVVTNTHRSELTEISGTKTWNDQNDQDGKRPSRITVKLMKNGSEYRKQEVTEKDNWKYTFKDLPVYEKGQKITYTVAEVVSEDYSSKANGYDLKNSYTPEKTSYSVVKLWDDADNQDGLRPASVKVQLYANGSPEGNEAELNAANGFSYTWTGLDLKRNGKAITYIVKEITDTEGYTVSYQEDQESHKTTITNSHTPATVDIPVTKTWSDADNQDGRRPGEITVKLLANGKVVRTQKLSAGQADKEGSWSYTFTGLPEKENGQKIVYTVTEEKVTGYETTVAANGENGFVIINSHTPETTEINGAKTWNDKEDKENARPDSITVRVFDGDQEVASRTVTEDDNWTWNFTGLPKYKEGKEIRYTVAEDHVPDYTTKVNGFNITNTYTPDETAITVVKVWDDAENQDCKRPDSITVVLHEKWGGILDRVREKAVLSEENNWSVTFDKLPVNKKEEKVNYWIEELTKVPGYDTVINNPGGEQNQTTITITNSYTPETVRIDGSKKWSDYDNQEGKRPESIQVILYQNGKETDQVLTVTPDDKGNWNYSFTDLPKYRNENGRRVENVYTVRELTRLADYETPAAGEEDNNYVIVNRMKPVTVSYSAEKNWNDDNNRDGLRKSITVQLLADGKPVDGKVATLTAENNWTCTWNNLPKYNAGDAKIVYTAVETDVPAGYGNEPGYTFKDDRTVITNSHTPELISISGEKEWKDAEDRDGRRPRAITVVLKADGIGLKETTVTADNGWKWNFDGLYKYENGREIVYTVEEKTVPADYTAAVTENADGTFTITNSYTPETTEVSGTKTWKDAENQDGVRPGSIMVYLKNGENIVASQKVTAAENWQYSFTDLPKYENQGQLISYTVDEKLPEGYEKAVTGADIINSYTPGKTSLTVKKHWSDAENQDGKRPKSIEVQLYADEKPVEGSQAELNEQNGWSHTWTELDQKRAGQNISYEAKEVKVPDGYEASYNNEVTGTTEITNSHTPEVISLSGSKVWSDAENQDGIRPSEIMVELYGTDKSTPVRTVKVSADADGKWSYHFSDLPKYENGEMISYTVSEKDVPEGYVSAAKGTGTEKDPFVITNTHTPEVISIAGTKTWVDGDNEEGKRPSEITVNLYKNVEKKPVASKKVKAAENGTWSYTFDDLPKYENGKEISYRVSEEAVKDYSASYNGNDIVNTYTPEQTQITVTKIWDDEDDQDGKRPESIEVQLYAGHSRQGEAVTLSESNQWTYTWKELPSTNALGFRIHYTVKEVSDRGEYKTTITGDTNVIITNSYTPEVTFVKVDKQWSDYSNQENKRPESIQVNLLEDGEVVDTVTLRADADGNWSHTFENLPKYRNDGSGAQEIQYIVKEAAMADYTSAAEKTGENTFVITNTMEPVFTEYEVTKFWDDADNQDGLRKEITVDLLADGKEVEGKTITLGTAQGETYRWTGLPKYNEEGTKILYTARETGVPDGYDENPGYVDTEGRTEITNRRNTEPIPTPGRTDPTPDPTTEVTPGITPPDEEVLGAKRVTDNAVLGARRGSDLAVLGKRRRPQTGDDMSLILWLIVLGTSMSCTGISIAMQYRKSTKKDKK